MKFIPNSEFRDSMLKEIGMEKIDELFLDISKDSYIKSFDLQKWLSQQETERNLKNISNKNKSCNDLICFKGGLFKQHYIPAVVKSISSRAEFFTAYTPYQSEASQGFLQAMFEFQSMIAEITSMDIANCSLYDGATALSEAVLMSSRINKKNEFLIPENISWEKKSILNNYCKGPNIKVTEVKYDDKSGKIDIEDLKLKINSNISGFYIENPNYFGIFEDDVEQISKILKEKDILFVVGINPISLGITKSPGDYGADIVIGEGNCLGNLVDFGGSTLGLFSCKKEYLRQMPGRIIGITKDKDGKRAFCMALQTREQHIRRGRATSNICTNEGLCALTSCIYLSYLGGFGLRKIAQKNYENAHLLYEKISKINGFKLKFNGDFFNDFIIECKRNPKLINNKLLENKIQGGILLENDKLNLKNCMILGATELHVEEDIDRLIDTLKEV